MYMLAWEQLLRVYIYIYILWMKIANHMFSTLERIKLVTRCGGATWNIAKADSCHRHDAPIEGVDRLQFQFDTAINYAKIHPSKSSHACVSKSMFLSDSRQIDTSTVKNDTRGCVSVPVGNALVLMIHAVNVYTCTCTWTYTDSFFWYTCTDLFLWYAKHDQDNWTNGSTKVALWIRYSRVYLFKAQCKVSCVDIEMYDIFELLANWC